MTARVTPPTPGDDLAEGFARHVARWAIAQGGPAASAALVEQAARALSLAVGQGHVCLELEAWAQEQPDTPRGPALRDGLLASGVVGVPEAPRSLPLVLDAKDRLYLHRYYDYERRLARRLAATRATPALDEAAVAAARAQLAALFAANAAALQGAADWQQLGAALALRGRLTVISGGPGTGKTTTVVNLLACLLTLAPASRIALAAPTGKAAARMTDAIRQRAAHLPADIRDRLPTHASTVHRLLGPVGSRFAHDADHPLPVDALIVDEASMLDLALATQLFEAVPPSARLILLGDKDQLAAVEAGAVFAELSADPTLSPPCVRELSALTGAAEAAISPPAPARASPLQDSVVWLTRTYRFRHDSGIGRLARLVNAGQTRATLDWLAAGGDPAVRWIEDRPQTSGATLAPALAQALEAGYAPYLDALAADVRDVRGVMQAFGRFRALCALRDGPRGVDALNAELTRRLRTALRERGLDHRSDASPWFIGRPVLVLNNDYVLKLFNGDIGIALPDATGELMVYFEDANAPDGLRAIAPVRLPRHESAFAMTVHKSQGSEFDHVFVLLPAHRSRVLTRELLYTGITRARERVSLAAPTEVLESAIDRATRRHSGLLDRLAATGTDGANP